MKDLQEWAEELPAYEGPRSYRRWGQYYEPAAILIAKGWPIRKACEAIAAREGLSGAQCKLLAQAVRNWRCRTGQTVKKEETRGQKTKAGR